MKLDKQKNKEGKYIEPIEAQKHLIELIEDGADIIDIGAESTRPYSEGVSAEEQIKRLPVASRQAF